MNKSNKNDFESSLQKLEDVVSAMEEDSIPLEDLLKHYEDGTKLIKLCENSLQAARKQLETIRKKSQDQSPPTAPEENADNEIRLF